MNTGDIVFSDGVCLDSSDWEDYYENSTAEVIGVYLGDHPPKILSCSYDYGSWNDVEDNAYYLDYYGNYWRLAESSELIFISYYFDEINAACERIYMDTYPAKTFWSSGEIQSSSCWGCYTGVNIKTGRTEALNPNYDQEYYLSLTEYMW